jgi:tryptophanyl-tRNA synthetase
MGLDPHKVIFFRQSDILQIFEFTWILNCFTPKGLLNRAHAYKAVVDDNINAGKQPDADVNAGLYNYPVLMAADILLYGSHFVPVGQDQRQHVEIARDVAVALNSTCGEVLTVPEALIQEMVMTIPGIDGRKMSKNYNNTIPIFDILLCRRPSSPVAMPISTGDWLIVKSSRSSMNCSMSSSAAAGITTIN